MSSSALIPRGQALAPWNYWLHGWSEQFNLRNEIETLRDRLADKGYADLDEAIVMRCLASIVFETIEPDSLVDKDPDALVQGMSTLKQAMFSAIDFLEKDILIKTFVFLPFPIMLVPLVKFFFAKP